MKINIRLFQISVIKVELDNGARQQIFTVELSINHNDARFVFPEY